MSGWRTGAASPSRTWATCAAVPFSLKEDRHCRLGTLVNYCFCKINKRCSSHRSPLLLHSFFPPHREQILQSDPRDCDELRLHPERAVTFECSWSSCYTAFPPGCGREYRVMVLKVSDGPPRGLKEHANIFHQNSITEVLHMSKPAQVVDCPSLPMFKQIIR